MSDETENTNVDAAAGTENTEVQIAILGQYIKDLSFENPTPAQTLQKLSQEKPSMDINVNLNARGVGEDVYEVDLKITATAKAGEDTAFVSELVYSGLFAAKNLPENTLQPFLMIEAPRQLFPFARRIISDVTRDGGFPPLMLEPIDFAALYQQQIQQAQAQQAAENDVIVN
ncbi:protein-export chaperone SecB [Paremcibacter congregatus]|uniref:Protein-export protein SecB n=1 Tax=Paremcibacter congregatus TaxID=2043170 RepID=A0A2G4YPN7_9PROT|nr:protein-export chaperone SecB [Paremcibacter congregatus]PHZ84250.1 protein-export chaperone SecB [Paremcibacter congregatus]QDE29015.1 protein-export chaperone SecB [Paremcibacter congregatus]|tara:strand:+ start:2451 stop:2966 length:516 start_codon:yes stop_codon:yes gene_type:complete